jgi:hypothetical protein
MKKIAKCEIEFEVEDEITKEQVEAYLWDHVAGMTLGDGIDNKTRCSLEETIFQGDNFDVIDVTIQ